ncbi:glycosyltransferase family 4 protein [Sphingomonas sinipercae]|uniref:Glycosyltransferase family 4 protein n=1 Tax=Sphingomonas sinipercae TaxID=2714944 RepID=A0A6G7ZKJ9_9SPHN|nr:glycosyltransferase family 4 protein [Sphingomonas sinipercae]QIL01449.1 glycosyltransferase family 4 protein [Sphingomonas sinipercae]
METIHDSDGPGLEPEGRAGPVDTQRVGRSLAGLDADTELRHLGVWIQGVDYLGTAYEGIWRVIKRMLVSSQGSDTRFSFVAPARFEEEIEHFFLGLPDQVRERVQLKGFGGRTEEHYEDEADRQAAYANDLDVDAWLIPNPMWGGSRLLAAPKVVWFHDFLLADFPQSYPQEMFNRFRGTVRDLREAGAFFIFTSPYVREKHGREACGIEPQQSMLIINPLIDEVGALDGFPDDPQAGGSYIRAELARTLKQWCSPEHAEIFGHHICHYPFESVPYLFVSSQNREHKGFLRLAQAHAALIREHYVPYSLFTTALADMKGKTPLERFLNKELLLGDFMSVGKVSDVTHALLFKFARMTVHPSTFEGNLPFTFSESVAVGTPCLVPFSRAYADFVDPALHPWVFYNATPTGLITKIKEVDANHAEFLTAQQQVLQSLRRNTPQDFYHRLREAVGRARDSQRTSRQVAKVALQVRMWLDIEPKTDDVGAGGAPVMHWATYLASDHPPGTSYLIASAEGDDDQIKSLELTAEIGSWDGPDYVVGDRRGLAFAKAAPMPRDLRNALELTGASPSFAALGERVAWTSLSWSGGVSPELRISGKLLANDSQVKVRLALLTGLEGRRRSGARG